MNAKQKPAKSKSQPRHRGKKTGETRLFLGGNSQPPVDPPPVAYQPWNFITLAWIQKPGDINFGDLVNRLKSQIDPKATGFTREPSIQMKVHSVRVWNLTDKTIALTVYDFHDSDDSDQLCGMMDAGSSGSPRLGYNLPLSHRSTVIRNDTHTGVKKLFTTSASSSSSVLSYVRMEWRFDGPVKGPTTDLNFAHQMVDKVKHQEENFQEVISKLKGILDAQPSLLTRVVDSVVSSAAEVSVVGDGFEDLTTALKELKLAVQSKNENLFAKPTTL